MRRENEEEILLVQVQCRGKVKKKRVKEESKKKMRKNTKKKRKKSLIECRSQRR